MPSKAWKTRSGGTRGATGPPNGQPNMLSDYIRMVALEQLLTAVVEKHVQFNRARLAGYDQPHADS